MDYDAEDVWGSLGGLVGRDAFGCSSALGIIQLFKLIHRGYGVWSYLLFVLKDNI